MPVLKNLGSPYTKNKYLNDVDSYYKSEDSVEKVIRYITRTRKNENRMDELISIGGCGVLTNNGVEEIIYQFNQTQQIYDLDNRGGRRLYHETYSFSDEEIYAIGDISLLDEIAFEICRYYYLQGYEAIYAIHYSEEKHFHIHIVHNSINFLTGRKYQQHWNDLIYKEMDLFNIVCHVYNKSNTIRRTNNVPIIPLYFYTKRNKGIPIEDDRYDAYKDYRYGYIAG